MNARTNAQAGSSSNGRVGHILRVLSFNIWGLAFISKKRAVRVRAIAQYLSASDYDIVCLQECWVYKDFELIKDAVASSLPYARFFNSGALGSGLAIFTRFPLLSAQVMPFDLSGTPQQAIAGDFFVNKAAGKVVVLHPLLGELEIWTTHMHAGGEHAPDTRQAHRIGESWQLANAVRAGTARGRFVMVMGDFNAQPTSLPIGLMRARARLTDTFLETHPFADRLDPLPDSPEEAIHQHGMSCDSSLNTWSASKNIPPDIQAQGGKRLDYIFYGQPEERRGWEAGISSSHDRNETDRSPTTAPRHPPRLRCQTCETVLTELVPGETVSYSDHFGLSATFTINPPSDAEDARPASTVSSSVDHKDLTQDDRSASTFVPALHAEPTFRISSVAGLSTMDLIVRSQRTMEAYADLSRRAATLHMRLANVFLVALIGLAVGSAWQPKAYIQPIFTVVAGILGAAAVTFFYLGFVWGRWEAGMLTELAEEMDLEAKVIHSKEMGQL